MHKRLVVIAGNIAAGKTTTVRLVGAGRVDRSSLAEVRESGLGRFYADPQMHAFKNQLGYSVQFLEKAIQASRCPSRVVLQDRSVYEAHEVFSRHWLNSGVISQDEFKLLDRVVAVVDQLQRPWMLILLHAPVEVLMNRIRARNHPAERLIEIDYLIELDRRYETWFQSFTHCPKERVETGASTIPEVVTRVATLIDQGPG